MFSTVSKFKRIGFPKKIVIISVTFSSVFVLQVLYYRFHPQIISFHEYCTFHVNFLADINPMDEPNATKRAIVKETIKILNYLGQANNSLKHLNDLLDKQLLLEKNSRSILSHAAHGHEQIVAKSSKIDLGNSSWPIHKTNITVGVIICGDRREQALIMLKSVVMFSLDVNLHVVAVSDLETILSLGQDLLSMKLGLSEIGYFGFTYELVLEWYPQDPNGPDWENMYRKCATQRLFLPHMLPHHDAMIYLDTDVLVIANLTEMWDIFRTQMKRKKMLGVTPNSESPGRYGKGSKKVLPTYGEHGINTGVMLFNLTQMRQFNFECRVKDIHTAFDKKIRLPDQDIINVMAHYFPEKFLDITCAYNFYWIHCNNRKGKCYETDGTVNACFCYPALKSGLRILHGNTNSFYWSNKKFLFMKGTFEAFKNLDLYSDSYSSMFTSLRKAFINLKPSSPCPPLTASILYDNAEIFLKRLNL